MSVPTHIPTIYTSLTGIHINAIYKRVQVLDMFSQNIMSSWQLFNCTSSGSSLKEDVFHYNPLLTSISRMLISPEQVEIMMNDVLKRTMNKSSHGPTVVIQRIERKYDLLIIN